MILTHTSMISFPSRSYISFDILRRVLSDYFGYDILYVMNITDIDDKIIKRARQNYLYEKYVEEARTLDEVLDDAKSVMCTFESTVRITNDPDKKAMVQKMLCNVEKAIENLNDAVKSKDMAKITEFQEVCTLYLYYQLVSSKCSSIDDIDLYGRSCF